MPVRAGLVTPATIIVSALCCFHLKTAVAASVALDPDSPSQIMIVGKIVPGDYDRFVDILKRSSRPIYAVNIVSLGGITQEAIKIGRLIRSLSLATNAPNTADFAPQARQMMCSESTRIDSSAPCTCASACFLIWAGGVVRSGNDIHLHRIAFDKSFYGSLNPGDAHTKYQEGLNEVHKYLQEMEIPDNIYVKMVNMPSYDTVPLDDTANSLWTTPSFGEWLTARCGPPQGRPDSRCEMNEHYKVSTEAVTRFRNGE